LTGGWSVQGVLFRLARFGDEIYHAIAQRIKGKEATIAGQAVQQPGRSERLKQPVFHGDSPSLPGRLTSRVTTTTGSSWRIATQAPVLLATVPTIRAGGWVLSIYAKFFLL
jgi:hypothetical protein